MDAVGRLTSHVSSPYSISSSTPGTSSSSSGWYGTPKELDVPLRPISSDVAEVCIAHIPVKAFRRPFLNESFIDHLILFWEYVIPPKIFRSCSGLSTSWILDSQLVHQGDGR